MINFQKTLSSGSILLRPIESSDFEEMKKLTKTPELWTYFTSNLADDIQLKKWIEMAKTAIENKERLAFTIIDTEADCVMGSTSLGNFSERDLRIEIGWTWLAPAYRQKGINKKVKQILLKYCFEDLRLMRVESKTDVLNIAARKGLLKSGFIEEGILRSHTLLANGRRRDSIYYSMLQEEYFQQSTR